MSSHSSAAKARGFTRVLKAGLGTTPTNYQALFVAGREMRQMSDGRRLALNLGALSVLLACLGFWMVVGTLALTWFAPQ